MPEKPEVVTVCKALAEKIVGKKITACNVYWNNIIAKPSVEDFKKSILFQKIHNVNSKGKFILIELDDYYLLIHLRMEGKFTFRDIGEEINKHEQMLPNIYGNKSLGNNYSSNIGNKIIINRRLKPIIPKKI